MKKKIEFHPYGKYAEIRKARNRLIDALRRKGIKGAWYAVKQYWREMKEIEQVLYKSRL